MKITRFGAIAAIALAGAFALSSCAANETRRAGDEPATDLSGTLVGAGASSQGSAQEAWIAAFQTANPDVTINYDPSRFRRGPRDLHRRRRPTSPAPTRRSTTRRSTGELRRLRRRHRRSSSCPTYISPIAVIFNVEGVDELNLDAATIAGIFKGTITNWNDPAIAALNEGVDAAGPRRSPPCTARTTRAPPKNFTDYLNKVAPERVGRSRPADPLPLPDR